VVVPTKQNIQLHSATTHTGHFKLMMQVNIEVNFTLEHAMKAQKGSRGPALFLL
jgi:hypothetical protein